MKYPSDKNDFDLAYLRAELARIDVLVRRQVARVERVEANDPPQLGEDAEACWSQKHEDAVRATQALVAFARQDGRTLRLTQFAQVFQLESFEIDAFLIALAPALDQQYAELYAYLQNDASLAAPRVSLVLDFLCRSTADRWRKLAYFSDHAPLLRCLTANDAAAIVASPARRLQRALEPDPAVVSWLLGDYRPQGILHRHARLVPPQESEAVDLAMIEDIWPTFQKSWRGQTVICLFGADRECQAAVVRRIASEQNRSLLTVNLGVAATEGSDVERVIQVALRDARLTNAVVHFAETDGCLDGTQLPAQVMGQFDEHPDLIVTTGAVKWRLEQTRRGVAILWQEVSLPSYTQRKRFWEHLLRESGEPALATVANLAGQFHLTSGQMRDVFDAARDRSIQRNAPLQEEDLNAAAREYSSVNLTKLATKVTPRYEWSDLILPDDQLLILREVVATVRAQPIVLDEWGLGTKLVSSSAVTMLFSGEPGTGKTMAAEVIANALGIDLFKINLSSMVSKYIGETEKNLEQIFGEAEQSNAILFFDEADAIFGKRTAVKDSHDRYSNIGVSYLLQRMERYNGVTVLATNLRANLDEAFTRRLQFMLDFPFPDAASRLRIWETLFPDSVPKTPDVDFNVLAERLRLAGGNIRNVIVTAAYLAADRGQPVSMEIMRHAVRREFQKMGRIIDEQNLSRLDAESGKQSSLRNPDIAPTFPESPTRPAKASASS